MADLVPVDHDPFAQTAAAAPGLVPVDHDPFAAPNAERFQPVPTDPNSGVADWTQAIQGPGYEAANRVFNKDLGETLSGIKRTIVRGAHDLVNPADLVSDVKDVGSGLGSAVASGAKYAVQNPTQVPGKVAGFVQDQFVNHPASTLLNLMTLGPEGGVGMMGVKGAAGGLADVAGLAKYPVSVLSGVSPAAQRFIAQDALAGNKAAVSAMRGSPIADPIDMAKNALGKEAEARQAQYVANKDIWSKDSQNLSYQPILDALDKAETKGVSSSGFVIDPKAQAIAQEMRKIVDERMSAASSRPATAVDFLAAKQAYANDPSIENLTKLMHLQKGGTITSSLPTPIMMDELKQRLGVLREDTTHTTRARAAVDQVYNAAKQEIVDNSPHYAKSMEDYWNASDKLNEISRSLSLNPKANRGTTIGKLQSMMRNDVSANYGQRAKLGEILSKHEPNLMPTIAGEVASSPLARGFTGRALEGANLMGSVVAGLAHPALAIPMVAGLAASSPRVVGETINALNRARRPISAVSGAAGRVAPPVGLLGQQSRGQGLLSP